MQFFLTSLARHATATQLVPRLDALIVALLAAPLFATQLHAADASPAAPPVHGILHLNNGGTVSGDLADSLDPDVLRWQSPVFTSPFDFRVKGVDAIYFPLPATLPKPAGDYCFELAGGDILFGSLLELDHETALLDVPDAGRFHVRRDAIRRFSRWKDGAGLVYRGPSGLDEWNASPPAAWHNEHGQLSTDQPRASLEGKFALPPRAKIEFAISWKDNPDFALLLGAAHDDAGASRPYRIEAWEHDVVILRETEHEAEISSLQKLSSDVSRVHLVVYLDQPEGRCLVTSPEGKVLANLKITDKTPKVLPALRLTNKRGDLRLERLEVVQWSGVPPRGDVELDKPRLHLADGTVRYNEISAYEPATKTFRLEGAGDPRLAADQIESAVLAGLSDEKPRPVTIASRDSSMLSGKLLKVEKNAVWIASPALREPLRFSVGTLRSLVFNVGQRGLLTTPEGARIGTLDCEGVHLSGCLIPAVKKQDASCLAWQPLESTTGSPLRPSVSGRIQYRETPAARNQQPRPVRRQVTRLGVNGGVVMGIIEEGNVRRLVRMNEGNDLKRKALYLMSGDSIPCEVTRIDQKGVSFTSPLSSSTFVPNEKVKAVELTLDGRGPVALTRSKRDRLLTVPRMQKGNPPTHLVRSRDGDYLRGRILEMDESKLLIEVRLAPQEVPRERISRIIWLHPDEEKQTAPAPKRVSGDLRVQAVEESGTRLAFCPEQFADSTLSGKSDLLGACRITLESVDQLLLGSAIDEAATRAAYQQWKLQYAVEPKFVEDEKNESANGSSGTESTLVGKEAPDFELDVIDGDKFHLAEHKGKIVVLDFWATWCSHCLETMPDFVRLSGDSAARNVEVVAINLEETPAQITAVLKRHQWRVPVALDRDGVVAAKYGVTAIPQTVIIGPDGKVVRHYIGGSSKLFQNIDESLRGLKPGEPPQKPAAAK
jgi:peroxiredoxin